MPAHDSGKVLTPSLSARINQLEHDIEIRRSLFNRRAIVLKQSLRQRLVSPTALMTYAGVGLAAGLLLRRHSLAVANQVIKAADGTQTLPGRMKRLFDNAFKIVAMVRTLVTILPAAPTQTPNTLTGTNLGNLN
jgi:hypothetical protein